jgi:hypothetical protein
MLRLAMIRSFPVLHRLPARGLYFTITGEYCVDTAAVNVPPNSSSLNPSQSIFSLRFNREKLIVAIFTSPTIRTGKFNGDRTDPRLPRD